jgi:transcriptional regulator with GAF, ATPase, and Fis domain
VSAGFLAVKAMIERTAASDATLLFMGETGVGKEVLAKLAHRLSSRRARPFVALNCAAIPEGLIESELFGVAKGAFTGAVSARPGRFELAHGGTLFLDEIATLSPLAQTKILRAIQEGEFERVGDVQTTKVDVRLIAASNVELNEAVRAGAFRADLFYRISTLPVRVPPLRQRREDIPVLLEHFRLSYAQRHGREVSGFTTRAINALLVYDFPGNVRELERMVERAVLLVDEERAIDVRHLFLDTDNLQLKPAMGVASDGKIIAVDNVKDRDGLVRQVLDLIVEGGGSFSEVEGLVIREALASAGGNVARAARNLGLSRRQLALRLEKMQPRRRS